MTINRIETEYNGQVQKSKRAVVPGFRDVFRSKWVGIERLLQNRQSEVVIDIISDDKIKVTHQIINASSSNKGEAIGKPRVVELAKHEINEHDVESPPSWRGVVVKYEWEPSKKRLSLEEELALKQAVAEGQFTEDEITLIRDNLIYRNQLQSK